MSALGQKRTCALAHQMMSRQLFDGCTNLIVGYQVVTRQMISRKIFETDGSTI